MDDYDSSDDQVDPYQVNMKSDILILNGISRSTIDDHFDSSDDQVDPNLVNMKSNILILKGISIFNMFSLPLEQVITTIMSEVEYLNS